jgi:very-short-patch-repair endonuclease
MKSLPLTFVRAKSMRHAPTETERRLWGGLRNRALGGFKFVRQQPIGPYIVDFVCREKCLVVEVDGATHGDSAEVAFDTRRTAFLHEHGYRVLRIENYQVLTDIGSVLDVILAILQE